jgi:hypothetical protein
MAKQPNKELVKYIEKHLAKGFSIANIKKKLAEVGHPIEAIEDAARFAMADKKTSKKKPKSFMVIYGVILILIIAGFAWFVWFKATQQLEYKGKVEDIKKNQSYLGISDVELLKLAANNGDMLACDFIQDHYVQYACFDRYWERNDCSYEYFIGERVACLNELAWKNKNISLCIGNREEIDACKQRIVSFAIETRNTSLCKQITGFEFDCITEIALQEDDFNICDELVSVGEYSRRCKHLFKRYFLAEFNSIYGLIGPDDPSYLDSADDIKNSFDEKSIEKIKFFSSLFKTAKAGDLEGCKEIPMHPDGYFKIISPADYCLLIAGFSLDDLNFCNELSDDHFNSLCRAKISRDSSLCSFSGDEQILCTAVSEDRFELCSEFSDVIMRNACRYLFV